MEKSVNSPVCFIERYNPRSDTWEEIHVTSSSELERDSAGITGSRDGIIISGGFSFSSCSVTSSVVHLNPASGERRELASLNVSREGHVAVVDDVSIYVIGGKNESEYLASVEKFDWETGKFFASCVYVISVDVLFIVLVNRLCVSLSFS